MAVSSCSSGGLDKELDQFNELLVEIDKSDNFFRNYKGVVIIPVDRCSSCVSVASKFASSNSEDLENVFFLVTEINTYKELKIRYDLEESNNVFFDRESIFRSSGLDFGNVGFYILNNERIVQKEVLNSSNVAESLKSFMAIMNGEI